MMWESPTFTEIDMSAEIGAYQDDLDPPTEPPIVADEPDVTERSRP